jgi:ADP-ribose pyrophosphatase YjhB (NUDIX family)
VKREYPPRPIIGVGAVIMRNDQVLLVKRGSEPGKNQWSVPGGLVELGETVHDTVVREVKEETSLDVEVHGLIDVVNNIVHDEEGRLRFHFVILDFFALRKGGKLQAGSDVREVKWVPLSQVKELNLTGIFRDFLEKNQKKMQQFANSTLAP